MRLLLILCPVTYIYMLPSPTRSSPALRYLAAKCHSACKEWEEAIALLKPTTDEFTASTSEQQDSTVECQVIGNIRSASLVLQGIAYEGIGSLQDAANCFKEAIVVDVFCEEALERLCKHYSLTADEEKGLLSSLPFKKQCTVEEEKMLRFLYQSKLGHGHKTAPSKVHGFLQPLYGSRDILCSTAEQHFQDMNIEACFQLTSKILEQDPYHGDALLLHITCCVQKGRVEELFSLGQRLVNYFPQASLAWYAVGCYYIVVKKHQNARKYLTKAITLDPQFAPAHMAFGLSFATEGEHDQAIAAFSNAARVMKGSHLPLMCLGREYFLTGATSISTRFMKSALAMAPHNPALLQEIGVMLTNSGNYVKAEKYLKQAIAHLRSTDPHTTLQAWEPVYNNLGHVYRKQKKYDLALKMHRQALQLAPNHPDTLSALAFVHLLEGRYEKTVEFCNQSLLLKREDHFTLEILRIAMEEMAALPLWESDPVGLEELDLGNEILKLDGTSGEKSAFHEASAYSSDNSSMVVE